jgi:hypothetical protein
MADAPNTHEPFTVTAPDGTEETVELPAGLADALGGPGEPDAGVAADLLVQAFAQRTHALHRSGDAPGGAGDAAHVGALADQMAAVFEDRFGVPLEDALERTGNHGRDADDGDD